MTEALLLLLTPTALTALTAGAIIGYFVGALPGVTAMSFTAVALPILLTLPPVPAIIFAASLYGCAAAGDAVPAILFNVPGDPAAGATAIEGHQLARAGKGKLALSISLCAALCGGLLGTMVTFIGLSTLGEYALRIGPAEMFAFGVLGVLGTGALVSEARLRGILSAASGALMGLAGTHPIFAERRGTFETPSLFDGFPLLAVIIGLFAVSEALSVIWNSGRTHRSGASEPAPLPGNADDESVISERIASPVHTDVERWWSTPLVALKTVLGHRAAWIQASITGVIFGLLPGIGQTATSFLAYGYARTLSRKPHLFGKGSTEGMTAADWSANVVAPVSLIPLFTLGIPGSAMGAIMLSILLLNGLLPGPTFYSVFETSALAIILSTGFGLVIAVIFGLVAAPLVAKLVQIPMRAMATTILMLSLIGAFAERGMFVDMTLVVAFGLLGWLMKAADWSIPAFVIGFLLSGMIETHFFRMVSGRGLGQLLTSPVALGVLVFACLMIATPILIGKFKRSPADQNPEVFN